MKLCFQNVGHCDILDYEVWLSKFYINSFSVFFMLLFLFSKFTINVLELNFI